MTDNFTKKSLVIDALAQITDKNTNKNVLDAHMIEQVIVEGDEATVTVVFEDDASKEDRWVLEDKIADAVEAIAGIEDANILTVTRSGLAGKPKAPKPSAAPSPAPGGAPSQGMGESKPLEGVGKIIAVASGKGGVGKSTVAVNLALALKNLGFSVGLLDVDIYGPSLPTLLGVTGRPNVKERKIVPLEAEGLKLMSLGFLMDEDTPVIWRGPIVSGIIRQFLQDVTWTGTDYLILDLPPGTGDAQLSLAQSVPLDGAIIVTTPSDLALVDAARGLQMFKTLKVDVMGIVENMAYYTWPGAEDTRKAIETLRKENASSKALSALESTLEKYEKMHIFGQGGGQREAKRLGTSFLGEIPLDGEVRRGGDQGRPIVVADPNSTVTKAFIELARRVSGQKPTGANAETGGEKPKRRGLFSFLRG